MPVTSTAPAPQQPLGVVGGSNLGSEVFGGQEDGIPALSFTKSLRSEKGWRA